MAGAISVIQSTTIKWRSNPGQFTGTGVAHESQAIRYRITIPANSLSADLYRQALLRFSD
jgi:hypothetical protein